MIDPFLHDCLQEGAVAATRKIHRTLHCSHEAVQARLERIRAHDPNSGILVVTQSLFPLNLSVPDLRVIRDACRVYNATLLVDISQDFGASGDGGLGFVGEQGLVGEVDILIGSFSKTLASNGGFVASRVAGLRQALHTCAGTYQDSNTLSPVQASVILAALDVIRSREGARRRRNLMMNILRLRERLKSRAFQYLGRPSAVVPVLLGGVAQARLMTRAAFADGAVVNLIEHPIVSRTSSQWRLQIMADHSHDHIDKLVSIAVKAREQLPAQSI